MNSSRANWLVALVSVFFTAALGFAAGEAYVRQTLPYETPDTLRQASIQYESMLFSRFGFPQMEQDIQVEGGAIRYHINKRGYRGPDFAVPKPPGTIRIAIVGGSAVFDLRSTEGRDWPRLIEKALRDRGWQQVEVINAGTPGYATWDSLGRLYSELWMFEPDYVAIYNGWNDIKYFEWLAPDKSLLRGYRPTTPTTYGRDLNVVGNPFLYYSGPIDRLLGHSQLYNRLRWNFVSWQLGMVGLEGLFRLSPGPGGSSQPEYKDKYDGWAILQYQLDLRLFADAVRDIGARPVFLTQATLVSSNNTEQDKGRIGLFWVNLTRDALLRAFSDIHDVMLAVAKEKDVPVLDLWAMFTGKSELFFDHIHTTPAGSEALAKATADFLDKLLKEASAGAR